MITLYSGEEIARILEACQIAVDAQYYAKKILQDGISTGEIDKEIDNFIRKRGAVSAFKGYKGYPANICISVNEEVVHGIPGKRKIRKGDLVSVDIGVRYNGFCGDIAWSYGIGSVCEQVQTLMDTTKKSMDDGINEFRCGNRIADISSAIQSTVEKNGFSVVRDLTGHGIGHNLHEDPFVPNFGKPGNGPLIKNGMVICIEPMVNRGGPEVVTLSNGWTVSTKDGSLSAHYENQIAMHKDQCVILTQIA
jgi:methionyl aminopeptidase